MLIQLSPSFVLERVPAGANKRQISPCVSGAEHRDILYLVCRGHKRVSILRAQIFIWCLEIAKTKEFQIHWVCWWTDLVLYISNDYYLLPLLFHHNFFAFLLFLFICSVSFFLLWFFVLSLSQSSGRWAFIRNFIFLCWSSYYFRLGSFCFFFHS